MDRVLMFSRIVQDVIWRLLGWLSSALLLGLTLFALLEIVRRYVFGVIFEWGQDAVIVGIVTAVALSFCVTQVRRGHLVMNAIVLLLHEGDRLGNGRVAMRRPGRHRLVDARLRPGAGPDDL